ncbi:MAG: peptidoglycan DD-metalloendopeptidase family protein [Anaerolineae bacterium]|nr:peptidoglycan DD-metalloendopeptidase family protein [Anaerolineae bacterium]
MLRKIMHDLQGFFVLAVALGIGALLLLNNARPQVSYSLQSGSPLPPTQDNASVSQIVAAAGNTTPIIATNTIDALTPPTVTPTPVLVQGGDALLTGVQATATRAVPVGPTESVPTSVATPQGVVSVSRPNPRQGQFSLPPELAPLSLDSHDHFWFRRPVDASANSTQLFYYTYGSNGPGNEWRVHHGLDMPNPIGKEVRAAGDGTVVWAGDNYTWKLPNGKIDRAYTYGNVIIIEHDFGYQGKKLYTLYAHLQLILGYVQPGVHVSMGDVIGLSGESGVVSGPHVHFEVRVGENSYYSTRNPLLWMTPYEGHGVIAGRLLYANGAPVEDELVTLTQARKTIDTTTTYVNPKRPGKDSWNVVGDDVRNESFVFGDVDAGTYMVSMNANGFHFEQEVIVRAGTTSFVDFGQLPTPPQATKAPTTAP